MTQFTYYGHSCFNLNINGINLLFDPFITPNELAAHIDITAIKADFILLSHGHMDHLADAFTIAQNTNATIICNWEIYEWYSKQGLTNIHPMNTGGKKEFSFGTVKCVAAQHSSGLPDGSYGGNPMGFIIDDGTKKYYFTGDTALTMDMQLVPIWGPIDTIILPIGDNFTMGYEDAALACSFAKTKKAIGVHFDTFGFIKINQEEAQEHFTKNDLNLTLPQIGATIDL